MPQIKLLFQGCQELGLQPKPDRHTDRCDRTHAWQRRIGEW